MFKICAQDISLFSVFCKRFTLAGLGAENRLHANREEWFGIVVVGGVDMGAISANGAEVRGSSCGFYAKVNKVKVNEAEGQVIEEGSDEQSTSGIKDTISTDLLGKEACDSGGMGGPTAHIRCMRKGDGI